MGAENHLSSSPTTGSSPELSDPERWVDEYGDYLFNYALSRLRDPLKAEDAVQEAFLAALKGLGNSKAGVPRRAGWWGY